jgi:hypothetical protein
LLLLSLILPDALLRFYLSRCTSISEVSGHPRSSLYLHTVLFSVSLLPFFFVIVPSLDLFLAHFHSVSLPQAAHLLKGRTLQTVFRYL